jgi:hypothetical protein
LDAAHHRHTRILSQCGFPNVVPGDITSAVLLPYTILPADLDLKNDKHQFQEYVDNICKRHFDNDTHRAHYERIKENVVSVVNSFMVMKKDMMQVCRKYMETEFEGYFRLLNDQVRCQLGFDPCSRLCLPDAPSDVVRAFVMGAPKCHFYILQAFKECDHCILFSRMVRSFNVVMSMFS